MGTIYTDELSHTEIDIELGQSEIGQTGRELLFISKNTEVRLILSDIQLENLADVLFLNGFKAKEE